MGRSVTETTESAAPPLASPSSLVKTIPSKSAYSWNACATSTAFWPVTTSRTSRTECGFETLPYALDLLHHVQVNDLPARRVHDDEVVAAVPGLL